MEFILGLNYTLIIVVFALLFMAIKGYQCGLMSELTSFLAVVIGIGLIGLVIYTARQIKEQNYLFLVIALVVFVIIMFLIKVGKVILVPMRLVSKLALIKFLNKALGVVIGLFKGVLYTWIILLLISAMQGTAVARYVASNVARSEFLLLLTQNNYFEIWFKSLF